jgi:radical SAM protein with 4Fe4S-binding SPASM domain
MNDLQLQAGLFNQPAQASEARRLFAETVTNVIVEISRYCNRQCSYCPVSKVDRITERGGLPGSMYAKILDDLAQISYAGSLCLNLYNEPMADRPLLLDRIREARAKLPACRIYFSTNGDFLSRDYVKAMVQAGLSELYVTIHMPKGGAYDDAYAISRFTELSKRLGKSTRIHQVAAGSTIQGKITLFSLPINVFSMNYQVYGTDRAGSVQSLTNETFQRQSPCSRPFQDFTVSYEGTIFPCCQMFVDDERHRENYAIGKVIDFPNIFEAYASKAMANWRADLLRFSPKKSPCDTCNLDCRQPAPGEAERLDDLYREFVGPLEAQPPHATQRPIFLRWLGKKKNG